MSDAGTATCVISTFLSVRFVLEARVKCKGVMLPMACKQSLVLRRRQLTGVVSNGEMQRSDAD